jgi:hypothetical protein
MNALLKVGTEPSIGQDVYLTLKQFFQLLTQSDQIQQASPAFHLD